MTPQTPGVGTPVPPGQAAPPPGGTGPAAGDSHPPAAGSEPTRAWLMENIGHAREDLREAAARLRAEQPYGELTEPLAAVLETQAKRLVVSGYGIVPDSVSGRLLSLARTIGRGDPK